MKKILKQNIAKANLFTKLTICFVLILLIFTVKTDEVFAKDKNENRAYLSEIDYVEDKTFVSNGHSVKLDKNDSDKILTLKVNDEPQEFIKGICAWATSEVVYDLEEYDYDYFTSYIGVDISEQSDYFNTGVKFYVYTSNDGTNWNEKYHSGVFYGITNAEFIKVDIKDARYLKLVADNNSPNWWAEWYDEAIYADAKLIKEGYVEDTTSTCDFIKTVEQLDEEIKSYEGQEITGNYELALLQRELVSKVGYKTLQAFVRCEDEYKETLQWLMTNLDNLRLYILGGEPDGNYISSLQALTSLYEAHKEDLEIKETTAHGTVYGELYKKMMITLSLTHSAQVSLWMDTTSPENQSDPVKRYEIFKELHKNNKFVVSENQDHTPWFEDLKVEEMRFVLNNIIDDEEILWLNEYTQKYIDEHPGQEEKYLQPHPYMKYIWPDYAREEFHDVNKKDEWDEKYGYPFSKYQVTFRPGVYKLWMNIEGGAVCGGISKIGSNIRGVHGTPSSVISQPGHAALIYYRKDAEGNGYWTIDNDVSGWAQSGKTERLSLRMPLGWGSDEYVEGWAASYIVLAQEALNHYTEYEESTRLILLANSYEGNPAKQEELYRKALKIQSYNIDAWYGLIKLYKADNSKTQEDYFKLAEEISENLKCFPLPMYNLTNLLKEKMVDTQYDFKFTILQTKTLTDASNLENDSKLVYQPSITRTVAKYLLGEMDSELATFSFDGEDAGKIVLSSRYDDSGVRWDYTLTGKNTNPDQWIKVEHSSEDEHKIPLTEEQLKSITAENDIYVHIVGVDYSDENIYKIDITNQELSPNLYANDLENRVIGIDSDITQWRYVNNLEVEVVSGVNESGNEWTSFKEASPNLHGNVSIEIRQKATGTKLPTEAVKYDFTDAGENDLTRSYVPVSHLSIEDVSTEEPGHNGSASNAIDGNYNTRYHSNWNGQDTQRYMVIKVDRPIYLSAVQFVPAGGGNGKIIDGTIYGSMDGETWQELSKQTGLTYVGDYNNPDFGKNPENIKLFEVAESAEVQYIKIVADKTNGNWFTARMFNIFQDLSKNPHPTAGIDFSTTSPTTENVEARLVNLSSTNVRITNNDGKDTYLFTDNGTFTFEFIDELTQKTGTAEAKVTWIDREAPTATVKYSTQDVTDGEVVAELVPSEEVKVTNNAHNEYNENGKLYTFTKNGKFEFEFEDLAGNKGTALAEVTWIKSKTATPDGYLPGEPGVGVEEQDPGQTTDPEEENKPGDTTDPEEENKPGNTTNPEDENKPGDTTNPEENKTQEEAKKQEEIKKQEEAKKQEELKKQEEAKKQENKNTTGSTNQTNSNSVNQNKTDMTVSTTPIPKTGIKGNALLITSLIIAITASIVSYIKFINVDKKHNK